VIFIVADLLAHGADVNLRSGLLRVTPLMPAAGSGNLQVVKELLARGAHINDKDDDGNTALQYATHERKWDVVKYLKEHGAIR
jgi:ankyrin repeat protein